MHTSRSDVQDDLARAIDALCDDNWQVRESAVEILTEIGDPAVPSLIKVMEDPRDEVRQDAAVVLNQLGWQPDNDKDYVIYAYASQQWDLLVEAGETAISVLSIALQDGNFYVRTSAVLALGEVGDPSALPLLREALRDQNSYVRSAAARSLSRFGETAAPLLGNALMDDDKGVRGEAAKTLVQLGEPAVPTLVEALQQCDWYLRREVAQALVKVGTVAAPTLIPLLQDAAIAHEAAQILEALDVDPAQYGYQGA